MSEENEPYDSFLKRVQKKKAIQKKSDTVDKLKSEIEELKQQQKLRSLKREKHSLKHPYQKETVKSGKRASGRAGRFAGELVKASAKSYGTIRSRAERSRGRPSGISLRSQPRSFVAPQGMGHQPVWFP